MIPTKEMLEAYLNDKHQDADTEAKMWFWAGIAAYAHLSSPASEEWKREHGFKTEEQ